MENFNLVKNQVIELADRFDKMQSNQEKQNLMISYLVSKQTTLEERKSPDDVE